MVLEMDEADVLFGDESKEMPEDEAELIFAKQARQLSLNQKLETQSRFRTASAAEKQKMLDRFCGPLKPLP